MSPAVGHHPGNSQSTSEGYKLACLGSSSITFGGWATSQSPGSGLRRRRGTGAPGVWWADGLQNPGVWGDRPGGWSTCHHLLGLRTLSEWGRWKEDWAYLAQPGQLGLLCHQHPCQCNFSETPCCPILPPWTLQVPSRPSFQTHSPLLCMCLLLEFNGALSFRSWVGGSFFKEVSSLTLPGSPGGI